MNKNSKFFVAGHKGLVGAAIMRQLESNNFSNIITRTHNELDLCNQLAVQEFISSQKPEYVVLAAGKVGGIHANNTYPAEFIYENMMIEANVIDASYKNDVKRLLFLGSSCIYPKLANQPMQESSLLTSELEPTNEPYAVAKIAGIKLCESYNRQYGTDYRSVMPTNLYGQGDNFHLENSHVIPALIRRFHEAKLNGDKQVSVWGTGNAKREFLHVDDMAAASLYILQLDSETYKANTEVMLSHINIGTGVDCSIREMAETIKRVVGFDGDLVFDASKPDGPPRKLLDVSRLKAMGWQSSITLEQGLSLTYQWFIENEGHFRA